MKNVRSAEIKFNLNFSFNSALEDFHLKSFEILVVQTFLSFYVRSMASISQEEQCLKG